MGDRLDRVASVAADERERRARVVADESASGTSCRNAIRTARMAVASAKGQRCGQQQVSGPDELWKLTPSALHCDACSRRCCASRIHRASFSSFAATAAQPTAVACQR